MKLFKFLIFLAGISFVNQVKEDIYFAYKSYSWPVSKGKIIVSSLESEKKEDSLKFFPKVQYEYSILNKKYINNKINFNDKEMNKTEADLVIKKYRSGMSVDVYYNIKNPEFSVLEPGMTIKSAIKALTGAFLTFFSVILLNLKKIFKKFFLGFFMINSGALMIFSEADKILSGITDYSSFRSVFLNSSGFALVYSGYRLCKPVIMDLFSKIKSFYYFYLLNKK